MVREGPADALAAPPDSLLRTVARDVHQLGDPAEGRPLRPQPPHAVDDPLPPGVFDEGLPARPPIPESVGSRPAGLLAPRPLGSQGGAGPLRDPLPPGHF